MEDQNLAKILISALQTSIYVDEGFTKTVQQNSMRCGTTIIQNVLLMHAVQLLKSDHSAPSGGRLNLGKNTAFSTSDFHLCGQRFHKNCPAEFNETWHNNYMEGVVDAHGSIIKIGSFSALWWKIELWQKY